MKINKQDVITKKVMEKTTKLINKGKSAIKLSDTKNNKVIKDYMNRNISYQYVRVGDKAVYTPVYTGPIS